MNEHPVEHRINLSSSWHLLTEDDNGRRINLRDLHQAESMSISLNRSFNCPSNLDDSSQIFLELLEFPPDMKCEFNGQWLGICERGHGRFEVTDTVCSGQNVIQLDLVATSHGAVDLQPRVNLVII